MKEDIKKIKFNNVQKPNFQFDLVELNELLTRDLDHDLTQIHRVEFYHIFLITEGTGSHTIDFSEYSYQKATLFTLKKGQLHCFNSNTKANGYLLLFTENFLLSHFNKIEVSKSIQLFNNLLSMPKIVLDNDDFNDILSLIERIKSEYFDTYDEFSVGIIRSALHMIITKLFRIKTRDNQKLLQRKYFNEFIEFQKLVEENYTKTKKVIDYANMMNCSTKTLNNICHNIIGKSAKVVIDELIITQIKRFLISTSLSVKEIAYNVGFDEPSNLYKYFKKYTYMSPESFRKNN
ncbi:helix-turn-helix domain-containing protein [uncultured Tenacibaculum sp.]|uniref:AraC family transcriptional regulator n=1 Tax=uncultured Tenacibaculum sp. TaxID=174713 RepID=UPI00262C5C85|nr:helix-turn-helix domain-containing protein [uncultured Tenacibaculum sp.]